MRTRSAKTLAAVLLAVIVIACGTNPVTGERELQFISESSEIQLGEKNYAPMRQAEGGEMVVMPELSAYVNEVGQKLARHARRALPYEFTVLNNSVPNAWALPGGKIAINRGLLTELKNEAELAAVLGHEIVHADARHGAKAQERGTLMQAGMVLAQVGAVVSGIDENVAGVALGATGLGLQALQFKYSREQELESDEYGTRYMKAAGYDPIGAVTLQETFVRLSREQGGRQGFFDRMFASHPPSEERVVKNRQLLESLGGGGIIGEQEYRTRIAALLNAEPAYDKYDQAVAALKKKEFAKAAALASEAAALLPKEGRFHELRGEIELAQKRFKEAIPHYELAIQLNPNYFGSYLGGGIAQYESGNKEKGREWLRRSNDLLPTRPAAYYLGKLAQDSGDRTTALQFFKSAAGEGYYGQLAAREFVTMDLAQRPEEYIAARAQRDAAGRIVVIVQNRAPLPLTHIQVTPVLLDTFGRALPIGTPLRIDRALAPNQQVALYASMSPLTPQQLQVLRVRVDSARVAD